jgi:hypothetical protein
MFALLCFFLRLASRFKSMSRLEAENTALRHQLIALQRKVHGRVEFTNGDRLFFILLYRWFSINPQGHGDHPARNARALASCWTSSLLALEVSQSRRSAADLRGTAGIDPADEH